MVPSKGKKKSHLTKQLKLRDNKFPLRIPMETGLRVWWCHKPGAAHKLGLVCVCSVVLDLLRPHGLQAARLLCLWNFPGKNIGVGCHFLLQEIFLTQGSNRVSCISYNGNSLQLGPPGQLHECGSSEPHNWIEQDLKQDSNRDVSLLSIVATVSMSHSWC